jgi:hypothetical protein
MPTEDNTIRAGNVPAKPAGGSPDESTGPPGFHTWRGVYWFVIGCFVLYVVLLTVFSRAFS